MDIYMRQWELLCKICYNRLIGSQAMHPAIKWLWSSHC
jgi:hypothetical protein